MSILKESKDTYNPYNTPKQLTIAVKLFFINLIISLYLATINSNNIFLAILSLFVVSITLGAIVYVVASIILSLLISCRYKHLLLIHPLFTGKHIWINQNSKSFNNKNCPKIEFLTELYDLRKKLPKGITLHCCTHTEIKKQIDKQFHVLESTELYKKSLNREIKQLRNKHCNKCSNSECSYNNKDNISNLKPVQFYGIIFKHKPE